MKYQELEVKLLGVNKESIINKLEKIELTVKNIYNSNAEYQIEDVKEIELKKGAVFYINDKIKHILF